jgi:N-acetylneuraminic acid mutarotase
LGAVTDLWAYSPANDTWTKKKNCPSATSMEGSVAFVMNNKAYVTLGWGGEKIVWSYDPETDDWDADGEMLGSYRIGAVAFVAGNKAIIGTGATASTFFKDFVEYAPK